MRIRSTILPTCCLALTVVISCADDSFSRARKLYDRSGLAGALAVYVPAASKGDSNAAFYVGTMYVFEAAAAKSRPGGWAKVRQLEDSALMWYRRAAQQGDAKARKLIALVRNYDRSALYISLQYIMNGTKPPPEDDLERYQPRSKASN